MFDILNGLAEQARVLILSIATVVWLGAVIAVAAMRRSILAAAGIFIVGGLLVAGMWQSDFIRDKSQTDINKTGAPVSAEVVTWTSPTS